MQYYTYWLVKNLFWTNLHGEMYKMFTVKIVVSQIQTFCQRQKPFTGLKAYFIFCCQLRKRQYLPLVASVN